MAHQEGQRDLWSELMAASVTTEWLTWSRDPANAGKALHSLRFRQLCAGRADHHSRAGSPVSKDRLGLTHSHPGVWDQ